MRAGFGAVSVIVPTLDEAENIVPLIERIYAAVPDVDEVIVVDDDSPDGTAEVAEQVARDHPEWRIRVERRLADHGLTQSLARGAELASGETVVWLDGDLSMPPEDIPRLLAGIADGNDIVVGSRFVKGGSPKDTRTGGEDSALAVLVSTAGNVFLQLLLTRRFKDYTSGFIAIRRAVLRDLGLRGDYCEYFIDLIFRAMRAGYRVLEVPYVCVPRQRGVSKTAEDLVGLVRRGRKCVATAVDLRWRTVRSDLSLGQVRIVRAAGWSVASVAALAALAIVTSRPVGHDFALYREWASQLLAGEPLFPLAASFPESFARGYYPYHPATPVMFVPFALVPAELADAIWTGGLVAVAAAVGYGLVRPLRTELRPWAWATLVFFPPLLAEIHVGNLTLITLALCLVAWHLRRRPLLSGAALAVAVGLKLMPVLLPLFFIAAGAWRSAAWAAALGSAALLTSVVLQGAEWGRFVSVLPVMSTTTAVSVIPLAPVGLAAQAVLLAITVAVTVAAGRTARDAERADVSYALALAAVPLAAPAIQYPYLVFGLPLAAALLRGRPSRWWVVAVAAALLAMYVPVRFGLPLVPFAGLVLLITLGLAAGAGESLVGAGRTADRPLAMPR